MDIHNLDMEQMTTVALYATSRLTEPDALGHTPLLLAAMNGRFSEMKALLNMGARMIPHIKQVSTILL